MAKQCFRDKRFRTDTLDLIQRCDQILASYSEQGYRMTLRQLYYRLVATDVIPNTPRSYKNLGSAVSDARLAGLLDWEAIEDRVRVPERPREWGSVEDIVNAAMRSFRLPRWRGQLNYVELWVEKDALSGVLAPVADKWHVTLMVNRGYSSQSAMYESAARFREALEERSQDCTLLYLGDHDPSGEDMVRDVSDRLAMFGAAVEVRKLALTMEQVEKYDPPPNPAKTTDSRYDDYAAKHGTESWEVDALPPPVLVEIIERAMAGLRDDRIWKEILKMEESERARLKTALGAV